MAAPKKSVWKPAFIELIRKTANVSASARAVDITRKSAYDERNRHDSFRAEWDDAMEEALDALEEEAWRRARDGTVKPVVSAGKHVTDIVEYSDGLMTFILRGRRKAIFGDRQEITGGNGGPIEVRYEHTDLEGYFRELDAFRAGHGETDTSQPVDTAETDRPPA